MSQKLLTSSFSNFKHENTSLNVILHSLQALKNWNYPKILFKRKENQQTISKCNCTETTDCASVHISRQLGQRAKLYRKFYTCLDTYPAYLEWQSSSPHFFFFFCTLVVKQGRLHSYTSDTLGKAISACQVTKKFSSLNRPVKSPNWNASSAKCYP